MKSKGEMFESFQYLSTFSDGHDGNKISHWPFSAIGSTKMLLEPQFSQASKREQRARLNIMLPNTANAIGTENR